MLIIEDETDLGEVNHAFENMLEVLYLSPLN